MGGAYFCGACGKKLTSSTPTSFDSRRAPSPAPHSPLLSPDAASKATAAKEAVTAAVEETKDGLVTPVKAKEEEPKGGMFSRLLSGRKKGEENKENTAPQPNSPAPPPVISAAPTQPPVASPLLALVTPVKSSVTSPTSAPSQASALPSPLSPPSPASVAAAFPAPTPARPTATAATSRPAAVLAPFPSVAASREQQRPPSFSAPPASSSTPDAGLVSSIRLQLQAEFDREQEILNMERDDLEQRLAALTAERDSLQQMVESALSDYQLLVEESQVRRNDYIANAGILEAEMAALRDRTDREAAQLHVTTQQLDDANRTVGDQAQQLDDLRAQLQAVTAELEELKARHGTLRDTATAKLKASAGEYMAIRQREQEKDILLHEIRRELQSAMEKNAIVGARCKEAEERSERLAGEVNALEEELRDTRNEMVGMSRELGEVKRVADEWKGRADENGAIAQRYKEQVLEQRERLRREEKERRDGGRGSDDGDRWRAEAGSLRAELEKKEAENRELMEMVESLIAQVEQQKQPEADDTY